MLRAWIERRRVRRRERIARDYGNLTAAERAEIDRLRDEERTTRARGIEETYGRIFDHELDVEEGRPRH